MKNQNRINSNLLGRLHKLLIVIISVTPLMSCLNGQTLEVGNYEAFLNERKSGGSKDLFSRPPLKDVFSYIKQGITILGFSWIDLPLNQIVILKGDENVYCGLKFMSYEKLNDEFSPTTFNDGRPTVSAVAELYDYQNKTLSKVVLYEKSSLGVGRINVSRGDYKIKCGTSEFLWNYPTGIVFLNPQEKLALGPTNEAQFNQINVQSPVQKWFEYDRKRQFILIQPF